MKYITDNTGLKWTIGIFISAVLVFSNPCFGLEENKILPTDASAYYGFGNAVSIDGDYLVVGAELQNFATGAAYLFFYNGTDWVQQVKLTASDGQEDDLFGCSVSISGDYIVVGADLDDNGIYPDSGSVYIFWRNQGSPDNWGQLTKIVVSNLNDYYKFGGSVSLDGDNLIVGAIGDPAFGIFSGAAYIFDRNLGGSNNWGQQVKLLPSDGYTYDVFGNSVSISGDYAVVGACRDDDNGTDSGSAYIFHRDQGGPDNWGELTKLAPADGEAYEWFGSSVSIDFPYTVIGADYDDDNGSWSGSAYIFYHTGLAWMEQAKLLADDGADNDLFGYSVSISGSYATVGADSDDDMGSDSGSAYVFFKDAGGVNNWGQHEKLTASDGLSGDWFGNAVAIDGERIISGAPRSDGNGTNSGSAYIYMPTALTPTSTPEITATPEITPTSTPEITATPAITPTSTPEITLTPLITPTQTPVPTNIPAMNSAGIISLMLLLSLCFVIRKKRPGGSS